MSLRLIASSQDCPPVLHHVTFCAGTCIHLSLYCALRFVFHPFFCLLHTSCFHSFLPPSFPSPPLLSYPNSSLLFPFLSFFSTPLFPCPPSPLLPSLSLLPVSPTPVSSRVSRRRSDSTHTCNTRTLSATVEQGVRMESSRSSWSRSLEVCVVQYRLHIICMCIHSISLHDIMNCIVSYKRKE